MTWWKYKPMFDIKWREPYGFTRLLNKIGEKYSKWWSRPIWGVVNTGLLLLLWVFAPETTRGSFVTALLICLGASFAIVYFVSFVHYFATRTIGFGEKAIVTVLGQNTQGWPYENIASVAFGHQVFDSREFKIMVVTTKNNQQLICAVPDKIDIINVINYLTDKGVETTKAA